MVESFFDADSYLVEVDHNRLPSFDELSEYSIRKYFMDRLPDFNIHTPIFPVNEGWPDYETLQVPSIGIWVGESNLSGVELGSSGRQYPVILYIFAKNDAERTRLGDLIVDIFEKTIPVYNFVTGNEENPQPTEEYFITDEAGWRKIPHIYNAPDAEKYRALATAIVRRVR